MLLYWRNSDGVSLGSAFSSLAATSLFAGHAGSEVVDAIIRACESRNKVLVEKGFLVDRKAGEQTALRTIKPRLLICFMRQEDTT